MSADEAVDFFDEVGGGLEGATTDGALGDEGEEAFDLVEPGGISGREVNVPTRTAGEPSSDLGMLVGGVVVDDEMDVELGRHIGLDMAEEGEELLVTMAGFALGDILRQRDRREACSLVNRRNAKPRLIEIDTTPVNHYAGRIHDFGRFAVDLAHFLAGLRGIDAATVCDPGRFRAAIEPYLKSRPKAMR